jgi:hypothetical protein
LRVATIEIVAIVAKTGNKIDICTVSSVVIVTIVAILA